MSMSEASVSTTRGIDGSTAETDLAISIFRPSKDLTAGRGREKLVISDNGCIFSKNEATHGK